LVEVLSIEGVYCAMAFCREGCGRQGGWVVGNVEICDRATSCAREVRRYLVHGDPEHCWMIDARPHHPQGRPMTNELPQTPAPRRMRPKGERPRPRPAARGKALVGFRGPGLVGGRDYRYVMTRVRQRVGFLDQPGVGRELAWGDQADPGAPGPGYSFRAPSGDDFVHTAKQNVLFHVPVELPLAQLKRSLSSVGEDAVGFEKAVDGFSGRSGVHRRE
jgi:hypothetical protein